MAIIEISTDNKTRAKLKQLADLSYIQLLVAVFDGVSPLYIVGGAVRDIILRKTTAEMTDCDLAVAVPPWQIKQSIAKFSSDKISIVPSKGEEYGTVLVKIANQQPLEISSFRSESYNYPHEIINTKNESHTDHISRIAHTDHTDHTDRVGHVGHDHKKPKANFTGKLADDLMRRDLNINALAYCVNDGKIFTTITNDINNHHLTIIGNPDVRIKEDPARIIRFIRFIIYMQGWTYEQKSLLACQNNSKLIKNLSGERISKEVRKIFPYKNCQQAFTIMEQIGISEEIFGQQNLNSQGLGLLQLASEKLEIPIYWQHQLACLVNYQITSTDYIIRRWRLSNADKKLINILTQQSSGLCDDINYGLLDQLTIGQYQWLMVKELANKPKTLLNNDATTIKQLLSLTRSKKQTHFPINGTDLKQLGIKGKDMGEMLRKLRKLWIDSEFSLTSPQLINKIEPQG